MAITSNGLKQLGFVPEVDYSLKQAADGEVHISNWMSSKSQPSESAITTANGEWNTAYDAQLYARKRALEYPSQGDQNDMIYKDMLNSTTTHKDAVEAVKTKWPKNNTGPVE